MPTTPPNTPPTPQNNKRKRKQKHKYNPLPHLPTAISHYLGYRPSSPTPKKEPPYAVYLWSFIGSFCGLAVLQVIFQKIEYFLQRGVVGLVASYGATAVLCYSTLTSPLAQPRALLLGHTLSALTSISLTKLFLLLPPATFTSLQWLLGSLSTALAIVIMQATGTTHPPAGATALLAAVDKDVRGLGWYLVPVVLLSGAVVLVTGLGVNNLQRRWPVFWWGVGDADGVEEEEGERDGDDGGEKGVERREEGSRSSVTLGRVGERNGGCEV